MYIKNKYCLCLFSFISFLSINTAHSEFMTEADRRAQLVKLAESSPYKPGTVKPLFSSKHDYPLNVRTETVSINEAIIEDNGYPQYHSGTIVIGTGQRLLHYIEDETTMRTYPIAVGKEGAQWIGTTKITHKRKNPDWRPTPNMRKRNPKLPEVVRAGPSNPLGVRAIYLAEGYLRIHGTNDPKSIGKAASSGCYRMHNEHVSELFELVKSGAKVIVLN